MKRAPGHGLIDDVVQRYSVKGSRYSAYILNTGVDVLDLIRLRKAILPAQMIIAAQEHDTLFPSPHERTLIRKPTYQ
jgi:hypothetical protein